MRLAVGGGADIAAERPDFLQLAIGPVDAQFALQNEGAVWRLVPMQRDLLVGGELEEDVDAAQALVYLAYVVGEVVEALERVPADVAVVEIAVFHFALPQRCRPVPGRVTAM